MCSSIWCPTCNAHHLPGTHLPRWDVWEDNHGLRGDYSPIHAATPDEAATRWARDYDDHGDYPIVKGETFTVRVAPTTPDHRPPRKYHVSGEAVAEYHAHEVDE